MRLVPKLTLLYIAHNNGNRNPRLPGKIFVLHRCLVLPKCWANTSLQNHPLRSRLPRNNFPRYSEDRCLALVVSAECPWSVDTCAGCVLNNGARNSPMASELHVGGYICSLYGVIQVGDYHRTRSSHSDVFMLSKCGSSQSASLIASRTRGAGRANQATNC